MRAIYLGGGYIHPARDIPQGEWRSLGKRKQDLIRQSGLYKIERKHKQDEEVKDELHS